MQATNSIQKGALFPLLAVNFIGTLGYSLVVPFLVYIVARFGGNEIIYGILGATYSFFQLFGAPILGKYSDIYGRRKVLFISQLGTLLSWVLFFVTLLIPVSTLMKVDSEWGGSFLLTVPLLLLFVARGLDGLTGGNISVATAYVVDISSEEERDKNMGRMALSTNLGFILGPLIAGLLGATILAEKLPVIVAIVISFVGLLAIVFYLPELTPTKLNGPPCGSPTRRVLGAEPKDCFDKRANQNSLLGLAKIQGIPLMFGLYFLIFLAFNTFYATFPIHALKALEWKTEQLGVFFAVLSGTMVVVQGPVLGYLNSHFSRRTLFTAGSILMFASFYCFSVVSIVAAYSGAVLFALGNGIMWPSFMALLAGIGPADTKGYIQGVAAGIGSFASILGLIIGGLVYARWQGTVFIAGGIIFLICFLTAFFIHETENNTQEK